MEVKELKRRWDRKEEECRMLVRKLDETRQSFEGRIEEIMKDKDEEIDSNLTFQMWKRLDLKNKLFLLEKDSKKQIDTLNSELIVLRGFVVSLINFAQSRNENENIKILSRSWIQILKRIVSREMNWWVKFIFKDRSSIQWKKKMKLIERKLEQSLN